MRVGEKETEIKLRVRDRAAARRRLQEQGFRVRQARSFEENTLFDTAAGMLRRQGALLRLRSVHGRHWLTFKGPGVKSPRYKIRPEWETEVADLGVARAILAGLGFRPAFRYEKYRTVLGQGSGRPGGEAMLDETPIGDFLELEGSRSWIRGVARALGARPEEFITKTYAALYADWCRRRGRPVSHMVFRLRRSPRGRGGARK